MASSYTSIQIIRQRLHWHSFGSLMVSGRFGTCGGGPKVLIFDENQRNGAFLLRQPHIKRCAWLQVKPHPCCLRFRGGGLQYKSDAGARRILRKKPLKGSKILFCGRGVFKLTFTALRGTKIKHNLTCS